MFVTAPRWNVAHDCQIVAWMATLISTRAPSSRRRSLPLGAPRLAAVAALGAIVVYCAVLAFRAVELSSATFLNADPPGAVYEAVSLFHGATIALHTEILPTLLEGVFLGLPGGHLAIQLLGPLLGLATIALMCWTVRRLDGTWLATAVAGTAAGPILLWSVLFPTARVLSFLTAALLAYALCTLTLGRGRRSLLVGCGVAAGIATVGDQGFLAIGIVPLLIAGGALWTVRHNRYDARAIVGILALAGAVTVFGEVGLRVLGVRLVADPFVWSPGVGTVPLATGVADAIRTLGDMVGGQWSGSVLSQPWSSLAFAAGLAVPLVAPAALIQELRRRAVSDVEAGRVAYLFFWTTADILVLAACVIFGYSVNAWSAHYLLPCYLSAVAALPFVAPARSRSVPTFVAAILAVVQAVGLLSMPSADFSGPHPPTDAARVVATLEAAGLTKGYADYWASHPLTWLSGETVRVYPVDIAGCGTTPSICRYQYADDAWYTVVPGRTFLILRRSWPCVSDAPTTVLGRPQQIIRVNADTTINVYGYDIAARLAPQIRSICAN